MENGVPSSIPTLDEISRTLSSAASLPRGARGELIARCAAIIAALSAPLLTSEPPTEVNGQDAAAEEVWLSADEAAAILHKPRRWLFRNSRRLPFVRRVSRKTLVYSKARLERWLAIRRN